MKKFLKSLLCFCCFALVFLTSAFACSAIEKANAVDVQAETTHTVNFYGADNETIIYSVEVPDGKSLNDFQNDSIVQNSAFSGSIDGWRVSTSVGSTYTLTFNDVSGFNLIYSDNSWFNIYTTFTAEQSSFYCRVDSSNPSLIRQVFASYVEDGVTKYPQQELISYNNHIYFKKINVPIGSLISLGFQVSSTANNIDINYFYASYNLHDYFNSDYLKQLFVNSGGEIGSNFEWSESSTSSSRFNFDVPITSDINLYGFNNIGSTFVLEAEISADYNTFGYYAINSVEFLQMSGSLVYHVNFTTNAKFDLFIGYFEAQSTDYNNGVNSYGAGLEFSFDNFKFPSFFVCVSNPIDFNSDEYSEYFENNREDELPRVYITMSNGLMNVVLSKNVTYDIYFYTGDIVSFNGLIPIFEDSTADKFSYRYYDDFKTLVDMKDTNTSIPLDFNNYKLFDSDSLNQAFNLISSLNQTQRDFYIDNNSVVEHANIRTCSIYGDTLENSFIQNLGFADVDVYSYVNPFYYSSEINKPIDFLKLSIDEFFFFIHRPSYRVDNTLVIYNFDYYNLLYSVNNVTYQLQVNGDFYDIIYNGKFPNNYFNYFYNDTVANTIYDEYVSLYLSFDDNVLVSENGSILLGFDFNFAFYVQPLVTSNGSYNYTFDKPGYVEMPFSLAPFHLPVLEAVENCMIFLVFYCPLISDVLAFLHFDLFFGGLISIFDFILGSGVGDFVLGCLAFVIYWSILKMLFPVFISSGRASASKFINDIAAAEEVRTSRPRGGVKAYKFKSGLGSNHSQQFHSYLKDLRHEGYRGKRNDYGKSFIIRSNKSKFK